MTQHALQHLHICDDEQTLKRKSNKNECKQNNWHSSDGFVLAKHWLSAGCVSCFEYSVSAGSIHSLLFFFRCLPLFAVCQAGCLSSASAFPFHTVFTQCLRRKHAHWIHTVKWHGQLHVEGLSLLENSPLIVCIKCGWQLVTVVSCVLTQRMHVNENISVAVAMALGVPACLGRRSDCVPMHLCVCLSVATELWFCISLPPSVSDLTDDIYSHSPTLSRALDCLSRRSAQMRCSKIRLPRSAIDR